METIELITLDNLAYRGVSSEHIMKRAYALSDNSFPNLQAALEETVTIISERFNNNLGEGEAVVYYPSTNDSPYVFGIPYIKTAKTKKAIPVRTLTPSMLNQPPKVRPYIPDVKGTTIREDFENALFEDKARPVSATDRNEKGNYVNPLIQAQWEGFKLYHSKFDKDLRDKQSNLLGRYVVARVTQMGVASFKEIPFRHPTKAMAMEEAKRLTETYGSGFAVFRCIEIVNKELDNAPD